MKLSITTNTPADEPEEPIGTGIECPDCGRDTAEQDKSGKWICIGGCKIDPAYYCPSCGKLFLGTQGYCDNCINDI